VRRWATWRTWIVPCMSEASRLATGSATREWRVPSRGTRIVCIGSPVRGLPGSTAPAPVLGPTRAVGPDLGPESSASPLERETEASPFSGQVRVESDPVAAGLEPGEAEDGRRSEERRGGEEG